MNTTEPINPTPQVSDLEPRARKVIARLYDSEAELSQKRHALKARLADIDKQIEQVIRRRGELDSQLQQSLTEAADPKEIETLDRLLKDIIEEQRTPVESATDQLSTLTRNLAGWADQAAEVGKSTWETLREQVHFSGSSREENTSPKEAFLKEVNQTVNDLGHQISLMEDKLRTASEEAKSGIQAKVEILKTYQDKLKLEAGNLRSSDDASWNEIKTRVKHLINDARSAIK